MDSLSGMDDTVLLLARVLKSPQNSLLACPGTRFCFNGSTWYSDVLKRF